MAEKMISKQIVVTIAGTEGMLASSNFEVYNKEQVLKRVEETLDENYGFSVIIARKEVDLEEIEELKEMDLEVEENWIEFNRESLQQDFLDDYEDQFNEYCEHKFEGR